MKKFLSLVAVVFCTVLLSGCGEKSLKCTKDISTSGITMQQAVDMNFNGNKITTMSTTISIEFNESQKAYVETMMSTLESTYKKQYGISKSVEVKTEKKSDLKYDITISIDYKNMSEADKKTLGMAGSENYDVNKKDLENSGYTCK